MRVLLRLKPESVRESVPVRIPRLRVHRDGEKPHVFGAVPVRFHREVDEHGDARPAFSYDLTLEQIAWLQKVLDGPRMAFPGVSNASQIVGQDKAITELKAHLEPDSKYGRGHRWTPRFKKSLAAHEERRKKLIAEVTPAQRLGDVAEIVPASTQEG